MVGAPLPAEAQGPVRQVQGGGGQVGQVRRDAVTRPYLCYASEMPVTAVETARQELDRRPRADSKALEELLVDLEDGVIRIPRFQRGLRWEDEDRRELFDSILRGYPIGTLLFWKRPAEEGPVEIGKLRIQADGRTDALWVVDGQQRLTTLANALLVPPDGADERRLFVDLETLNVQFGREMPAPRWLPMYDAADTERLLEWVHQEGAGEELRRVAFAVGKRLRQYEVPLYVVETDEEDVLREIFDRINSTGKTLTRAEVFDALHGSKGAGSPGSLEEIAEDLSQLGFGSLEEKLILRALLALRGKDPSRGFRQIDPKDVPIAFRETLSALRRAIVFARDVGGFPHVSLLPYKLPLVTLSLFFHSHPEPRPRTKTLLRRWIWRGAISGGHKGDTVGTRRTLEAIDPQDEEASVQALIGGLEGRPDAPIELRPFNFGHARSKLHLVALAELQPRNLKTEKPLDVAALCDRGGTPAQPLTSKANPGGPEGGLAGRVLHPPLAAGSLRRLIAEAGDTVLESHGIPLKAAEALRRGNTAEFFEMREAFLEDFVGRTLDSKAEWGATDRPSLAYLVAPPKA